MNLKCDNKFLRATNRKSKIANYTRAAGDGDVYPIGRSRDRVENVEDREEEDEEEAKHVPICLSYSGHKSRQGEDRTGQQIEPWRRY